MKKVIVVLALLLLLPSVNACYNPMDSLAVEVSLNKPGIFYNLATLRNAKNVIIKNGSIVYLSHYDAHVAVILHKLDSSLWIRIQIPAKKFKSFYSYASFETISPTLSYDIEKIKKLGWEAKGMSFRKGHLYVQINPKKVECRSDVDCAIGGCNGEVCAPLSVAKNIVTTCVYKRWYSCFKFTSCGCYHGICTWKPNPNFEECLKEHGGEISRVVGSSSIGIFIADYGKERPSTNDFNELETLFKELGISYDLKEINFKTETTDAPVGVINPYSFNFSKAVDVELTWLKENGIVRISNSDINEIVRAARKGKAGYNSHIGWYKKNGVYMWIPYDESDNPRLVKCISSPFNVTLPNDEVELTSYTPGIHVKANVIFVIVILLVILLFFLFSRRF